MRNVRRWFWNCPTSSQHHETKNVAFPLQSNKLSRNVAEACSTAGLIIFLTPTSRLPRWSNGRIGIDQSIVIQYGLFVCHHRGPPVHNCKATAELSYIQRHPPLHSHTDPDNQVQQVGRRQHDGAVHASIIHRATAQRPRQFTPRGRSNFPKLHKSKTPSNGARKTSN